MNNHRTRGFSLIEVLVTLTILGLLATLALPLSEITVKREKERLLRRALNELRDGIDAYKRAADQGRIARNVDESGYPPTLDVLIAGVPDLRSPRGEKLHFMRRIPRDPFAPEADVPAARTWGLRSYASPASAPREGADVFDVYSFAPERGLNGVPYAQW